jgi:hypothetical protein
VAAVGAESTCLPNYQPNPLLLNRDILATRKGDHDGYDVPVLKGSGFKDSA